MSKIDIKTKPPLRVFECKDKPPTKGFVMSINIGEREEWMTPNDAERLAHFILKSLEEHRSVNS